MRKFILLFTIALALFSSCKKDDPINVFTGYNYYPDNVGHELVYDVDSIVKNDFNGLTDTSHFQVKEIIESIIEDNEGRPTMRLERYKRLTPSDPWIIYKVWTANKNLANVEKKEDNITYIKLVFPPQLNNTWDGNDKNNLGEQQYEYSSVNDPDNFNGYNFDSTLSVLQRDDFDILEENYEIEKYAAGVGVYYKEQRNINFNYIADTIESQRIYIEKLIDYSN